MGRPLDEQELRRRAIEGVRNEIEAFGCAAPDSLLIRHPGLLAAVVPAASQRYEDPAALAGETAIRWYGAFAGGEPAGCVGTIADGEDCRLTSVATSPEHDRRGIATWLMHRALAEARAEGLGSASLHATRAGAPVYERLGFHDLGCVEMWEMRS